MFKLSLIAVLLFLFHASLVQAAPEKWLCHKTAGDHYLRSGKISNAVLEYKQALALYPDSPETWFNLAIACYRGQDLGGAVRTLEKAAALKPEDAEALYNLGCLCLYDGRTEQARNYFEKAKTVAQNDSYFLPLITRGLEFTEHLQDSPSQGLVLYLLNHGLASALPFQEPDNGFRA